MRHAVITALLLVTVTGCRQQPAEPQPLDSKSLAKELAKHVEPEAKLPLDYTPAVTGDIEQLDIDAAKLLRNLPHVNNVVVMAAKTQPVKHRVIHLLDHHLTPEKPLEIDLAEQLGRPLTSREFHEHFIEHLIDVKRVQLEQVIVLVALQHHHSLQHAYIEGLIEEDLPRLRKRVAAIQALDQLKDPDDESGRNLELMSLGAVARMLVANQKIDPLPLEDAKLHVAARPKIVDGMTVVFDQEAIKRREDAMVERLLKRPVSLCILGGDHDLSDNVPPDAEYLRVTLEAHPSVK